MDYNKQHPLSQITCNNSFSVLEMLIPYVDYPFKLPLALLIKFNEIRIIINTFRNIDLINQFGLHNVNSSMTDILSSMTGISPDMLRMLMGMAEHGFSGTGADFPFDMQNLFHGFETDESQLSHSSKDSFSSQETKSHPINESNPFHTPTSSLKENVFSSECPIPSSTEFFSESASDSNDFDNRIYQIFNEYDKNI